jgi:DnaA-homolog protein
MNLQLTLPLQLEDDATFSNFFTGENIHLIEELKKFVGPSCHEQFIFLWSLPGGGRSHLLQACCHEMFTHVVQIMYLNLADTDLKPRILHGLESMKLICLDDIHAVLPNPEWAEELFHFYNRARDANTRLLVSANAAPKYLKCALPDLTSRLTSGLVFQLHCLDETQKLAALQLRAQRRGLKLTNEVGQFLLRYYSRDMKKLFVFLEQLDQASLTEKRRLTIPFLKKVLK